MYCCLFEKSLRSHYNKLENVDCKIIVLFLNCFNYKNNFSICLRQMLVAIINVLAVADFREPRIGIP